MKKEIIICIAVIVIVIVLNTVTGKYTKDSVESMKYDLNKVKQEIEQNKDKNEISENVENTRNNWNNKYKTLAYYIEHDELEKVTLYLVGLDSNVKSEEYSEAIAELDKCVYILDHIQDKYSFNLRNIF